MPLTDIQPGRVEILEGAPIPASHTLAKLAAHAIKADPRPYQFYLCAPTELKDEVEATVQRTIGERRASLYRPLTPFELFQTLQHAARRLSATELASIRSLVAECLKDVDATLDYLPSLDRAVLEAPEDPAALAYLAALRTYGVEHPYLSLASTSLPVSVRTLYVACFDELPAPVQDWILALPPTGVSLVLSCRDGATLSERIDVPAAVQTVRGSPHVSLSVDCEQRVFPSVNDEMRAIVEACAEGSLHTVFCRSVDELHTLETRLLCRSIDHCVPAPLSIMNSDAASLVASYLDFARSESSDALRIIRARLGLSEPHYARIARKLRLPWDMSTALMVATTRLSPEHPAYPTFEALQALIILVRSGGAPADQLAALERWSLSHLPQFDQSTYKRFASALLDGNDLTTLSAVRERLYSWFQRPRDAGSGCSLALVSEIEQTPSDAAWLQLSDCDAQTAAAVAARARHAVSDTLTVSIVK